MLHMVGFIFDLYQLDVNFMLNDDFVIFKHSFLKDLSGTINRTSLKFQYTLCLHMPFGGIYFFNKSDDNFPFNENLTYYVYSHQTGGITGEHCATDIMLYIHVRVETMAVIAN